VSKKQHNFMAAVAKNPAFAKKVGMKASVGEEFLKADKGKKFGVGGGVGIVHGGKGQINKQTTRAGSINGSQKEVPNINLNKYIGMREGGMTPEQQKKYYADNAAKGKAAEKAQDDRVLKPVRDAGEAARKGMEEGRMDQMGNSYKKGGKVMEKESKSESKKEMAEDKKQDVAMIKKAFKEHDAQEHKGGKGTKITLKAGGKVRGCGIASKGLTKGKMI
jgi:hypothetical protein